MPLSLFSPLFTLLVFLFDSYEQPKKIEKDEKNVAQKEAEATPPRPAAKSSGSTNVGTKPKEVAAAAATGSRAKSAPSSRPVTLKVFATSGSVFLVLSDQYGLEINCFTLRIVSIVPSSLTPVYRLIPSA